MPPRFADLEVTMVPRSLPVGGKRVMTRITDMALKRDIKTIWRCCRGTTIIISSTAFKRESAK